MRADRLLQTAATELKSLVGDRALFEARLLLCHILSVDSEMLICEPGLEVKAQNISSFQALIERRKKSEPIAYLLGSKEFYGRVYKVDSRVLIPRPETEGLVEGCLEFLKTRRDVQDILELGVGSGCISVSLALERLPVRDRIRAIDISSSALELAHENVLLLGADWVELVCADILEEKDEKTYDLIVSNPPYIPQSEISELAPDIKTYEPLLALEAGDDGLKYYRSLINFWMRQKLRPHGLLALETHNSAQRDWIQSALEGQSLRKVWIEDCHIFIQKKD